MTVSPDGGRIVYSAVDASGNVQLYLRALNEFDAQPIRGTEAGYAPFFSPDGQWVGFAASGSLKKVPLAGGPVLTIAEEVIGAGFGGASWGADDTIVFTTGIAGLVRVPAAGGIPETLATPEGDAGELSLGRCGHGTEHGERYHCHSDHTRPSLHHDPLCVSPDRLSRSKDCMHYRFLRQPSHDIASPPLEELTERVPRGRLRVTPRCLCEALGGPEARGGPDGSDIASVYCDERERLRRQRVRRGRASSTRSS